MEGELGLLGHHSPAGSSCVSSDVFGSPIPVSPRAKLLDSSPSSCVSDGRSKGGRPSSPTRRSSSPTGNTLDSPASCVSDGRYVSPLRVSAEQEREAREAEMLLRAIAERYDDCFLRLRDATAEVAELRLERLHLRAENVQLSLLLEELEANQGNLAYAVAPAPPPKLAEEAAARGGAPKSISIRSKCYLSQMKQPQGEAEAQRLRVRPPPPIQVSPRIRLLRIRCLIPPRIAC
jgi:butyrate response factor 1